MKGMVKVYRIEDENGIGPYCDRYYGAFGLNHVNPDKYPSPEMDGIRGIRSHHKFGFTSMRQLRDWFNDEEIFLLRERGLKITVYRVPRSKVKFGTRQVAFETR